MEHGDTVTMGGIALRLGAVLLLVFANGFFVASEFALVAARRSRIDQLVAEGDRSAAVVQKALTHLDRYISGTQLGITLASLALGWIGEPALAALLDEGFRAAGLPMPTEGAHTVAAIAIAFTIITFLHIVFGELAPKSAALVAPERVSRLIARPLIVFSHVMSPAIWLLNGAANRFLRMFGVGPLTEASRVHWPEEIRLLVMQSSAHGQMERAPSELIAAVFDFHEKRARDVMRPRTEVIAISRDATEAEVREIVRTERFSRYPVYTESLDEIEGVFLAKDLWLSEAATPFVLAEHVRQALYVPDSRRAERVFDDLRKSRAHMAIVLDEYGGTAGILTIEDLIEEVVGDISDEYDLATRSVMESDGVLELAGAMSLIDVRSDYRLMIPDGDWTTLGGYVFSMLGRLPRIGDRVTFPGGGLEVVAMDSRRVAAVRVLPAADAAFTVPPARGTAAPGSGAR
ncbi:MAG TPA: hemolysin family protein [Gemmatimonadaceae bacterium]|nr:hemolysin family protein [Gemmatimonadaceae bacterium]